MNSTMHFKRKWAWNKKHILIAVAAAAVLAIIVLTVVFVMKANKEEQSSNQNHANEIDTTLTGDASLDPQNTELQEEEGADVQAEDLVVETGRSNGIDVSKWQGKIDWKKAKQSGVEFAFIRIGYRGENGVIYRDENVDYNIQQAQKAGVLVGVYFFSTAVNETEAVEEAKWTLQAIEGYPISYPVVYDCEGYKVSTSRMYSVTAMERTNNAIAFLKTVSDAGYDVMIYGARNEFEDAQYWDMAQIEKQYKVWVAQYPFVTYPEKDESDYNRKHHAWQYTNKGKVAGISGNVDMVVCYFTKDEASPKNKDATPKDAKAPLTNEEKLYTLVSETVTAKDRTNLRNAATTRSDIVATLTNGETVTRIGIGTNGWSKLSYNGTTVYAITSYLTTDLTVKGPDTSQSGQPDIVEGHTFTPKSDSVTAKEFVNLRALPKSDSELIGTLNRGEFLTRTAVSDKGWSRLIYNGQTVYAVTSYLSNEVLDAPTQEPPTSTDGFTTVDEQVTAKEETNLRTKPSTGEGSEVVYLLPNGEYVRRIGIHPNGWSKLEYNGQIVYAVTSYLTK